jgi:hypothetical protein
MCVNLVGHHKTIDARQPHSRTGVSAYTELQNFHLQRVSLGDFSRKGIERWRRKTRI